MAQIVHDKIHIPYFKVKFLKVQKMSRLWLERVASFFISATKEKKITSYEDISKSIHSFTFQFHSCIA